MSKKRPVRCVETGEVFDSLTAAGKFIGASDSKGPNNRGTIHSAVSHVANGHHSRGTRGGPRQTLEATTGNSSTKKVRFPQFSPRRRSRILFPGFTKPLGKNLRNGIGLTIHPKVTFISSETGGILRMSTR